MSTWNSPPQIPAFKAPPFGADQEQQIKALTDYIKQLANIVSALKNDLEHMLNGNLDVKNIRAKGIDAERLNVDELSAITAAMGKLTSGEIYGAYIATAEGAYPRAEMSSAEDLFAAYATVDNFLKIYALNSGTPMVYFNNVLSTARLYLNGSQLSLANFGQLLLAATGNVNIESTNPSSDVRIVPGSSGSVKVPSWSKFYSESDSQSLQAALNSKANAFSGFTGSFDTGDGRTAYFANGICVSVV